MPGMYWDVMVQDWRSLYKFSSRTEEVPAVFPESEKLTIGVFVHSANVTCSNEALVFRNLLYSFLVTKKKKKVVLSSLLCDLSE